MLADAHPPALRSRVLVGRGGRPRWRIGAQVYRYFSELLSVFTTPPVFTVLHGNQEAGTVDQGNFVTHIEGPRFIGWAGCTWRVLHVDWKARKAHVEPDGSGGKTRWMGSSTGLSFELAQSMQRIAASEGTPGYLSRRGVEALERIPDEFVWVRVEHTHLLSAKDTGKTEWWTFAGQTVNHTLADILRHRCEIEADADSQRIQSRVDVRKARECLEELRGLADVEFSIQVDPEADSAFKLAELLPPVLAAQRQSKRHFGEGANTTPKSLFSL